MVYKNYKGLNMKQLFVAIFLWSQIVLHGAAFTVTNTLQSGPGSLRAAIISAQSDVAGLPHTIVFAIPTSDSGFDPASGVWTIVFTDEGLPALTTGYICIDGATQTTFAGNTNPNGPEICLNGNQNTVEYCLSVQNSSYNTIRGLIINEFLYGIQIYGSGSQYNTISSCYIGCNHDGTQRKGNFNGIEIISGAAYNLIGGSIPGQGNLLSGNEYAGLRISDSHYNQVLGNLVGVSRSGNGALHNYDGITIEGSAVGNQIGGSGSGERNVASGNIAYGIDIFGEGCAWNIVRGNYIGTDITGSFAIPNTYGLLFDDRSHNNVVGGYLLGEGNLISGNTAFGAYFYNNGTNSNALIGNKIGTDISGTSAIPNETGVHVDGATYANLVDSNLISGNLANGITLFATYSDYNIIIRNKIGTDINGTQPLGNGMNGILITQGSANNSIGGDSTLANIIAYNGDNGVKVESDGSVRNRISYNSFFGNGTLSIELYPSDGPNANDAGDTDMGPNQLLNSPVIDTVYQVAAQLIVEGLLDVTAPEHTRIEVYRAAGNASGNAEGFKCLGTCYANGAGEWQLALSDLTSNAFVALAIDSSDNTSEFSPVFPDHFFVTMNELSTSPHLSVWPNPSDGMVIISTGKQGSVPCKIVNESGELMFFLFVEDSQTVCFPEILKGVFFLNCCSETFKIIIE